MSITTENLLSNEDYLLVEANTLGAPLNVYKLKPSYIRFIRRVGLFIFWFGVIVLVFAILSFLRGRPDDLLTFFVMALLPGLYAILQGGMFYRIEVNRARRMHIVICEQGLLYVSLKVKRDLVEVIRWKDVQEVKKEFIGKSYYLSRRGGMPITLSGSFENLDELIATIRERSKIEEAPDDSL